MEQYADVQQLMKKEESQQERKPIYPATVIQAVFDGKTGASLEAILAQFNSIYVQYQGTPKDTRLIIPMEMRRAGLTITYMDMDSNTITERANSAVQKDNDHWALDVNWSRVDELSLSGDISVSAKGTWIINGKDTGVKAVGPKGYSGLTPWLKTIDNKLHFSYDNVTWEPCSDYIAGYFRVEGNKLQISRDKSTWENVSDFIAAWFRWNDNKIQISRDNKTWTDLSGRFADNVHIKGYVANYASLPTGAAQGDIYGVGPTYAAEDTAHTNPIYRYYVRNANTWVDNGSFTSFSAGVVQETGNSETEVMSQKAVSGKLSELGSKVVIKLINEGVINGSSITESSAYRYSEFIPVTEGDIVKFRTTGGSSTYVSAGYSSKNISSFIPLSSANVQGTNKNYSDSIIDIEFVVDSVTKYILIGGDIRTIVDNNIEFLLISKNSIQGNIKNLSNLVAKQIGVSQPINIFHEGLIIGDSIIASGFYSYSDFIPVTEGDIIRFYSAGSSSYYICAGYRESSFSSFLSESSANVKGVSGTDTNPITYIEVTIDNTTKYVVIGGDSRVIGNSIEFVQISKESLYKKVESQKTTSGDFKQIVPIKKGKYIDTYGVEKDSAAYGKSSKIDVKFGQILSFSSSGGKSVLSVVAYNNNDINIGKSLVFLRDGDVEDIIYHVPKDITHVVIQADIRVVATQHVLLNYSSKEQISSHVVNPSIYSIRKRKPFVSWVMDCGAYCFTPNTEKYIETLRKYGFNKTSFAILPNTIGSVSVDYYADRFMSEGHEIVLHSDARVYDDRTEEGFEKLMQTYMEEMSLIGANPNGFISLSGLEVPSLDILSNYCCWGHSGPKNYELQMNDYHNGLNTISTVPYHLNRLNVEQTIEQRENKTENIIIERAKEIIDEAISNNGYLVFYTHSYKETELSGVPYTLYEDVFIEILEYIKEKHDKGLLDIGCMEDIMGGYYQKRYNE